MRSIKGMGADTILRWPLVLSLVLAGQLMVLSLGMNLAPIDPWTIAYWVLHGVLMAFTAVVLLLLGYDLVKETFAQVGSGRITIESMFTLSALGAAVVSLNSSFHGEGPIFYEVVAIVLCIYTIGKKIGNYAKEKVLSEISSLRDQMRFGWVLQGDQYLWQDLQSIQARDCVKVPIGAMIPIDGKVLSGEAFVNESAITGEPFPKAIAPGQYVFAGSLATDGELVIEAMQPYGKRLIDGVLVNLEASECVPSRLQVRSDRLMQAFVPFVLGVSALTFLVFWIRGDVPKGILNSMSVLLVACPCALGLATPIAVWSALWNLLSRGVLLKNGTALDGLAQSKAWVFDKTGTLSDGVVTLGNWDWAQPLPYEPQVIQKACAVLQNGLDHPVARAFASYHDDIAIVLESRQWHAGQGVEGHIRIGENRVHLKVGHVPWMEERGAKLAVSWNGQVVAHIDWTETLREGAVELLNFLKEQGQSIYILTGDASERIPEVASVKVLYHQTPLDKLNFMKSLRADGVSSVFVGDGINDAAAMAQARVGIAVGSGPLLTQAVGQILLTSPKLLPLKMAYQVALKVQKGIDSNMLLSFSYNVLGIGLAAVGALHPVVAALIMTVSSTVVCVRAARSSKI
jgi:heavy metal translocating P-type ATPase